MRVWLAHSAELDIVRQAHHIDQADLLFQPICVILFTVIKQRGQHIARLVILFLLGQFDRLFQEIDHMIFVLKIIFHHLGHGFADLDRAARRGIGHAFKE